MVPSSDRSKKLRKLIGKGTVMMPGAFNALSARMIERCGFDAMYLSGAVLANSVGGVPDIGMMTLTEARDHAWHVAQATDLPILMDADTGFGEGPHNISRTVQELEHAGVSAIHIEDQVFPKRCGHLEGKQLISIEAMCEKIAAAVAAKASPDFIVMARTDARSVEGYDAAVVRANAYIEAGADGIFPEALQEKSEFIRFAEDLDTILLANMTEFGKTPYFTSREFRDMGYDLVIFPVTLQRYAMKAIEAALRVIKKDGTQESLVDDMQTRAELYELLGYDMDVPGK